MTALQVAEAGATTRRARQAEALFAKIWIAHVVLVRADVWRIAAIRSAWAAIRFWYDIDRSRLHSEAILT